MPLRKKPNRPEKFRAGVWRAGDLIRTTNLPKEDPILTLTSNTKTDEGHVICAQDMVLLFAARGIGKSLFALGMSIAMATGGEFLCWKAKGPRKVLYIDGEMPGRRIQKRLREMTAGLSPGKRYLLNGNLAFIARDQQIGRMPRLDTPEGEAAVERLMDPEWTDEKAGEILVSLEGPQQLARWGAKVVIIDNAACLFDSEGEKDSKAWQPAQDWLQDLRDAGMTTILVHHASRAGGSRGHSSKEDLMDTAISLMRPQGYSMREGAKFKVEFTKGRSLFGDAAEPFIAHLDRETGWSWKPMKAAKKKTVDPAQEKLHEAIRAYVRGHNGCSSRRIEERVHGSSAEIRIALKTLISDGEIKKLENGGLECL